MALTHVEAERSCMVIMGGRHEERAEQLRTKMSNKRLEKAQGG